MRIAFLSPGLPWSWGPYQYQAATVARELSRKSHSIIWISLLSALKNRTYTVHDLMKLSDGSNEMHHPLMGVPVVYRGTGVAECRGVKGMYTSTLNAMLFDQRADALVSLMDHLRVFADVPIAVPSLAWFPDHYASLDVHHRHVFAAYTDIVALSPSSRDKVRKELPWKRVAHVPHVVTLPPDARIRDRSAMRIALHVPADAFVVFVNFGNYDSCHNRKSIDIALLAFRNLLNVAPTAKIVIHAMATEHVFGGSKTSARASPGIDVPSLCREANLPADSYLLHTDLLPYAEVLERIT